MLSIPIPKKLGTNFLDGDGHFELSTDQDVWTSLVAAGKPFSKDSDSIAEVKFGVDTSKDFSFGRTGDFKLTAGFKANALHQVHLLWPGQDDEVLKQHGLSLSENALCARLVLSAGADGAAKASFPAGPLSVTVGIAAGGSVSYERWVAHDSVTPALTVLTGLYNGIRLPQHIDEI